MSETQKFKKARTPWFLGGFVLFLLTFLILMQSSTLWRTFSIETANDTLLLYALSSLNFFAFVIFGFILLRNLIKLTRERRSLALGAKLKTRLWLYFFAVSILPIIAMAVFSYLFMNRALERWFTSIPNRVISEAKRVQDQSIKSQAEKLAQSARMLAVSLDNKEFTGDDLKHIAEAGNLTHVEILAGNNRPIAFYEKNLGDDDRREVEALLGLVRQGNLNSPVLNDTRGFDAAIGDFSDGRRLLIVPDRYAEGNVSQMIDNSVIEFENLKQGESRIRQLGLSTLGVLTFLLLFASSWTALYIARGLTVPIKALAEGADEIAQGNYGRQVEVLAEDELALLIESFNQMSSKLASNSDELLERRRFIETVLQSLPTGVISFGADNRVTTINKAAVQILRLEDSNIDGFTLDRMVNDENRVILERLLNRARRIGQASEQTVLRRENTRGLVDAEANLPVALTATALPEIVGTERGAVLVIEDLSELITAQRASAWQEVARRMAHEIKNPLTPIQLSAERIAKRCAIASGEAPRVSGPLDSAPLKFDEQTAKVVKEGTQTILSEVSSLKALVDEFSRFARLPNVKLENGDLGEIMRASAALFQDRGVELDVNIADNIPPALIDEEQLRRVFVNLIENAVEAFDESKPDKKVIVKAFYDTGRDLIVAEVSDNGNGITPADFQKLFQPYFSTKGRGTGLGLAIVQRIVSEHHGKIKAVNNQPSGAKFIVELPVAA